MVQLVTLTQRQPVVLGPGRVVPADVATRLLDLGSLHAEADQAATATVAAAAAEADAIREAARAEGVEAATAEIQDRLFDIAEASLSLIAQSEERILDLALQIAERIIGSMPHAELARQVAARSLQLATRSHFIRLRVAPQSVGPLQAQLDAILPPALSRSAVEVVGDARITDAGCVLETDAGLIDATIESQIAAIRRGLERSLSRRAQD